MQFLKNWLPDDLVDRSCDVHLRLLAEAATEALKSLDYLAVANSRTIGRDTLR